MTREDHLNWAKARAVETLYRPIFNDTEAVREAYASLTSDLQKHPELESHPGLTMLSLRLLSGRTLTRDEARKDIEGFQ